MVSGLSLRDRMTNSITQEGLRAGFAVWYHSCVQLCPGSREGFPTYANVLLCNSLKNSDCISNATGSNISVQVQKIKDEKIQ